MRHGPRWIAYKSDPLQEILPHKRAPGLIYLGTHRAPGLLPCAGHRAVGLLGMYPGKALPGMLSPLAIAFCLFFSA